MASPDPNVQRTVKLAQKNAEGEFPNGRLNPDDQGAVAMSCGVEDGPNGKVVAFHFPKPVAWFAVPPDMAMQMASVIIKQARAAGSTMPLRLEL